MGIDYYMTLEQALEDIRFTDSNGTHLVAVVHPKEEHRGLLLFDRYNTVEKDTEARENIVFYLNHIFKDKLARPFSLKNWILDYPSDELAYFLCETGLLNAFNHSQYGAPYRYHLWKAMNFIVAVEQKGKGFNAKEIDKLRIGTGKTAFDFYRNADSVIFFDNPANARIAYMKHRF